VCDASPRYSRKLSDVIIRRSSTSQANEDLSSSAVSEEFARATIATYDSQQERNFLQRAAQAALLGQGQGQGTPPSSTHRAVEYPTLGHSLATLSTSTSASASNSDFRVGSDRDLSQSLSTVDISGEERHTDFIVVTPIEVLLSSIGCQYRHLMRQMLHGNRDHDGLR
jgi:hypothetical protein